MWQPLTDRVLVHPFIATTHEVGKTIVEVKQTHERPHVGRVVSLGPDAKGLKTGDVVAFGKFAGVEVKMSGQSRLIMRTEEILGRQAEADMSLTKHVIDGAEVVHEAEYYCQHCDPLKAE